LPDRLRRILRNKMRDGADEKKGGTRRAGFKREEEQNQQFDRTQANGCRFSGGWE
jgi:hypothetical protein